jgi:hypothetical protein
MADEIETVMREVRLYAEKVRAEMRVDKLILHGRFGNGTADVNNDGVEIAIFVPDYGGKTREQVGFEAFKLTRPFESWLVPRVFPTPIIGNSSLVDEIMKTGQEI